MAKKRIYCDYNASTPVHPDVQKTITQAQKLYANPSGLYREGRLAREAIDQAREHVASYIHARPSQVIFTGSGTESNNQVIKHALFKKFTENKPVHILYSSTEHSSVRVAADSLRLYGVDVDCIPVDSKGHISPELLRQHIKPHTLLISIMLANNETGTIQSLKPLIDVAHDHGALFHSDAVQALGKVPINVSDLAIDFMSFSGHKLYAPKGIGALYVKEDDHLSSFLHGGAHERHLRASTENITGIMAFDKALSLIDPDMFSAHTSPLIHQLSSQLTTHLSDTLINGDLHHGLTNTLNISFKGVDGHALAMCLDLEGINVSTGSACSVGSIEPSPVLQAMGLSEEDNKSSLRFSIGMTTSSDDIDRIASAVIASVNQLRSR